MSTVSGRLTRTVGPTWAALLAVFALLLATFVVQVALQVGVSVAFAGGAPPQLTAPPAIRAVLVVGQLTLLGVGAWYATRRLGGLQVRVPAGTEWGWLASALLVKYALFGLSRLATSWLGVQDPADLLTQAATAAPWLLPVVAVLSIVLIGPAEETFYRGAVQGRLRLAFGPVAAVLLAGALFALPHFLNYVLGGANPFAPGALIAVGAVFATGSVMGYAYERTGNLAVPILLHGIYNASLYLAVYGGLLHL